MLFAFGDRWPWIPLIRSRVRQLARAKRDVALKARCSFKMVISRLREHLARGQFNSGWMIAPSHLCCPSIFLRLPLSTPVRDIIRFRSFKLVLYTQGATLRLPSARFFFSPRVGSRSHLCTIDSLLFLFCLALQWRSNVFSPLELFQWKSLLVSIDPRL